MKSIFTQEQDLKILALLKIYGPKWKIISKMLKIETVKVKARAYFKFKKEIKEIKDKQN